jgi:hypothetical protein
LQCRSQITVLVGAATPEEKINRAIYSNIMSGEGDLINITSIPSMASYYGCIWLGIEGIQ